MTFGNVIPKFLGFCLGSDGRVVLGFGAEAPRMFFMVEHQVLDAGLNTCLVPGLAIHLAQLEATACRYVYRMGPGACLRANFINQCSGQVFNQRRVRPKECVPPGVIGLDQAIDVFASQLLHLIVYATHQSRRCDQGEQLGQQILFYSRETARGSFKSRELEGAGAGLD
ncbi:hypothetical protein D3C75_923760 [compost metagenome]